MTDHDCEPKLNVVLYQPEIPQNTGNIGRTCVALNARLWLVKPVSFSLDSSHIRRSGMDYWQDLDLHVADHWEQLVESLPERKIRLVSRYGRNSYTEVSYDSADILVFGSESKGLPGHIHEAYHEDSIAIPMPGPVRCLNLATSAGIVLYEAARQMRLLDFSPEPRPMTPEQSSRPA